MHLLTILTTLITLIFCTHSVANIEICNQSNHDATIYLKGSRSQSGLEYTESITHHFYLANGVCHTLTTEALRLSDSIFYPDSVMANKYVEFKIRFNTRGLEYSCHFIDFDFDRNAPRNRLSIDYSYRIEITPEFDYNGFINPTYNCKGTIIKEPVAN